MVPDNYQTDGAGILCYENKNEINTHTFYLFNTAKILRQLLIDHS
jgi:hypothetical protein